MDSNPAQAFCSNDFFLTFFCLFFRTISAVLQHTKLLKYMFYGFSNIYWVLPWTLFLCSTKQGNASSSNGHGTDLLNQGLDCVVTLTFDLSPRIQIRIAKQVGLIKWINCIMHPLTVRQTTASSASFSWAQNANTHSQAFGTILVVQESIRLTGGCTRFPLTFKNLRGIYLPCTYQWNTEQLF